VTVKILDQSAAAGHGQAGKSYWKSGASIAALTLLLPSIALAQTAPPVQPRPPVAAPTAPPATTPAVQQPVIRSIAVVGNQRLEADTIRSYIRLRAGQRYSREMLDQALKDLYATELFANAQITDNEGALVIQITENPVVNRILLEGNKRLKEDKILPEIKLSPRQIFTRSKVRADVARIIELYKRQGRFAAVVEPKMVQLDQNRVDLVFEISEGPKSKVQAINIIGNDKFSDGRLRGEMYTKVSKITNIFSSGTSYDPDRLAADQQKLRQFYLTQGYADFRVVSAVAELTSNKQDFIITYVVEEGERYTFDEVKVDSKLRDFKGEQLERVLPMKAGDTYNAKLVEDTVESLTETAGLLGYAFVDIDPRFKRDKEKRTMGITFQVAESPRVYVERIDVNGNTLTVDKVLRREFRLNEGDAFNSFQVKRSENRIKSLGYFQENFEIERKQGSAPDRIILEANVEEKPTGELQLSAGFSSIENFILNASIRQRNFRGKGQQLRASANYSSYSKSVELGFTEPFLFDKPIFLSGDIYRRDLNSFNFINNSRETTFQQTTTGASLQAGVPITEYTQLFLRYSLNYDDITLDRDLYFFNGACDPLVAGRYLCDALGKRTTSLFGFTLQYNDTDNAARPSRGQAVSVGVDFAGLGGSVKYMRTTINSNKFFNLGSNFVLSLGIEGGYIKPFGDTRASGEDRVRLTDRFYLGEPQIRGFDIRGVGPRVRRFTAVDLTDPLNPVISEDRNTIVDDALGGRAYYKGRAEIEIPLGSGAKELGLRPSVFVDFGSVFNVKRPTLTSIDFFRDPSDGRYKSRCRNATTGVVSFVQQQTIVNPDPAQPPTTVIACGAGESELAPFDERFSGDTWKPRLSIGFGVNWRSPFGPFRIDIARALLKEPGDDTKLFTFNVGTQF
jgi:outer membrane protein insertion porin family